VGSGIAAEIATMKVSEEIDALEMMSISPSKFLVMPRLVALLLMFPVISVYFTVLGTLGGGVVAFFQLEVNWDIYYRHVLESLHFKATYVGLLKSCIFGIMVAGICCGKGLLAVDGAMGVGKATRSSVIGSLLMVLIIGYYVTAMFYGGGG
jgi:phospholipid/cholesterol/gamma-HCH transport system permease protein